MRLLALSILLLIGCSPASSPDTAEITIGRPEKEANGTDTPKKEKE